MHILVAVAVIVVDESDLAETTNRLRTQILMILVASDNLSNRIKRLDKLQAIDQLKNSNVI